MNSTKIIAVVLGVLMIGFAGAFAYTYSDLAAHPQASPNTEESAILGHAFSHWNDISIENSTLLGSQYASNATLQWVGGPLTGTYHGVGNITSTWNKFFGLWSAVWFYSVNPPAVSMSGIYATVTSQNQFIVTPLNSQYQAQYINVSYTLVYSLGKVSVSSSTGVTAYTSASTSATGPMIQKEIWKITGSGFVTSTEKNSQINQINSLAFNHWNNIAIENITTVMQEYATNATLHWANGPLKGNYNGYSSIMRTWTKFFGLWNAVWFYSEAPPIVTMHGNSANVNATVQFIVQSSSNLSKFEYINVTYGIEYYNMGFDIHTGAYNYEIIYENFDNTAIGPINKV